MYYAVGVKVVKTLSDIGKLVAGVNAEPTTTLAKAPTRPSRSALGYHPRCSVRSPPGIHSEMSRRGAEVIPRRGTMFECVERFHTTASWYKVYGARQQR